MACTGGRTTLRADEDRRLFAESAGTCLLCNRPLFTDLENQQRSVGIAERAHIVAHSDEGPRARPDLPSEERAGPSNLVLLCPTCHTEVDKAPKAFPVEDLLQRKSARATAVARVGGTPFFASKAEARGAVQVILERNRLIFDRFGPDSDGALSSTEDAARWSRHVLEDIVPGNEAIVSIVSLNTHLATRLDIRTAELLRLHTLDLSEKHRGHSLTAPARRFPVDASQLFTEDEG